MQGDKDLNHWFHTNDFWVSFPALFHWISWFGSKRYPSVRRRI